jgi:enoyl-CoA hydratase
MCQAMTKALLAWKDDPDIEAVMIDHAGERGFCAGGDIRMLAESAAAGGAAAGEFFFVEYRLNHLLFVYPKPVIAVMDGTVMGGGVGLSMPATYRIATERTRFAMPETGIGLFPDVGGGWHLPRLHGRSGLWIVLTGARLGPADCELLGIATDVVPSALVEEIKVAIIAEPRAIERILTEAEADAGHPPIADHREDIDRLFAGDSLAEVVEALRANRGAWAEAQLAAMAPKSPLSSRVSFRLLAGGLDPATFADNMATEYRIACRQVMTHDFSEGVRAVIVEKDNAPKWRPADLDGVTEALVDEIFAPLPAGEEWTPLPGL